MSGYLTGLKELDYAIGEVKKGSNLILMGPPMTGKEAILNQIISYGATEKENAIMMVTTREPANHILNYLKYQTPDFPVSKVGLVDCVSQMFDDTLVESENIKLVNSPIDLTGIGVKISQFFEDFYIKKNIQNIQFHINSLSTIMMYSNLQTVFRFLNVYTGRIRAAEALGIYVIDSGMHDERSIATLKQLCDGLIEVKSENDRNFVRIAGSFIKPTPWFEYEIINGKVKLVENNTSISNSDNKVLSLSGIIRNIAEGKKTREKLLESKIYYRQLFETAKDGILILDAETCQITDANPSLINILGYSREELLEKKLCEIGLFKDIDANKDFFLELQAKKNIHYEDIPLKIKDGKYIDVELISSVFQANSEKVIQCNIRDITDRKLKALKEREERYRLLVEYSPFGIIIQSDNKIEYLNQGAMKILGGKKPDELVGKTVIQFIHPDSQEILDERYRKEIKGEVEPLIDAKLVRLDGTSVDVEIMSIPFAYNGRSAIYRFFQEITKRRQAEDKIRGSLKEKEILLKEIHHRVKNNMQVISSLMNLQSKYIKDDKYLNLFKESQNTIKAMSIIHERLYHSEDLSRLDIKEYIKDLVNNLFQAYNINKSVIKSNINVETFTLGIDFAILCGLIINELVTNSIKYAFPDGRKGEIKIDFKQTDENDFELVVSDNGVGIPEDLDIRKTKSLGLRLITMLVDDQLEGEINLVRSKGTEFQIKFKGVN
jgi:PAS domain S-box-containing protein